MYEPSSLAQNHPVAPKIAYVLACALLTAVAVGAQPSLTVAISPDIPPYVMSHASAGLEVDILTQALAGHTLTFVQMPYAELQDAITAGRASVSAGVQHFEDDGVFYSRDFVTFVNAAISKKSAGLDLKDVDDLAGHRVLAWQDADLELGPEFERLFAPGGSERANYVEIADQLEQVQRFWQAEDDVIVIDLAIFNAISRELGHPLEETTARSLFPPVTNFRVGFKSAEVRDGFDRALDALCDSGAYAEILERYDVQVPLTPCSSSRR